MHRYELRCLFLRHTVPKTGHGIHKFKRSTEIAPPASLAHFNLSPRCRHRRRELRLSLSSCPPPWNPGTSSTTGEFSSFFAWNARYAKPAVCASSFYIVPPFSRINGAKKAQLQRGQLWGWVLFVCFCRFFPEENLIGLNCISMIERIFSIRNSFENETSIYNIFLGFYK